MRREYSRAEALEVHRQLVRERQSLQADLSNLREAFLKTRNQEERNRIFSEGAEVRGMLQDNERDLDASSRRLRALGVIL